MPCMKKRNERGFTLVELMLVTLMLAVVSLAIYSTLNNGIKIWQKINRQMPEEDLNIFFDKYISDLKASFKIAGLGFSGKEEGMEFATLIDSPQLQMRTVGQAHYFYDDSSKTLSREQRDYSQIYKGESRGLQPMISDLKSCKFSYFFYDKETKEYVWKKEWSREDLPLAVRVTLDFDRDNQTVTYVKTVNIPCTH